MTKKIFVSLVAVLSGFCISACMSATQTTSLTDVCRKEKWGAEECGRHTDKVNQTYLSTVLVYQETKVIKRDLYFDYEGYSGTGFVIEPGDRILTAYHNVSDAGTTYVNLLQPQPRDIGRRPVEHLAKIVSYNSELDVAVLKLADPNVQLPPPLQIDFTPPVRNQTVWQFGQATHVQFGQIIGRAGWLSNDENLFDCSMRAVIGDSGSPITNDLFQVIGMTIEGRTFSGNISFLPMSKIAAWLKTH